MSEDNYVEDILDEIDFDSIPDDSSREYVTLTYSLVDEANQKKRTSEESKENV